MNVPLQQCMTTVLPISSRYTSTSSLCVESYITRSCGHKHVKAEGGSWHKSPPVLKLGLRLQSFEVWDHPWQAQALPSPLEPELPSSQSRLLSSSQPLASSQPQEPPFSRLLASFQPQTPFQAASRLLGQALIVWQLVSSWVHFCRLAWLALVTHHPPANFKMTMGLLKRHSSV